jgi:hypothetical protein
MKVHLRSSIGLLLGLVACCAPSEAPPNDSGDGQAGGGVGRASPDQQDTQGAPVKTQPAGTPLTTMVTYSDGGEPRTAWVSVERIAEFQPSEAGRDALLAAAPGSEIVDSRQELARVWRVTKQTDLDALAQTLNTLGLRFSPILHDSSSPGSTMRALPGGVIVTFDPSWDRPRTDAWCERQGLTIEQPVPGSANTFLVKTPPGLEALRIANRLQETGEVRAATPNWWREAGTR